MEIRTIHTLSSTIRGRRIEMGLTQDELAKKAGVSRQWIYGFEAGKPHAEIGVLMRVLEALGLSLNTGTIEPLPEGAVDLQALLEAQNRG